jgi:hypothetical protein
MSFVMAMQVARLILVILIGPSLARYLARWFDTDHLSPLAGGGGGLQHGAVARTFRPSRSPAKRDG